MALALDNLTSLDLETYAIDRGQLAPVLVCASMCPAMTRNGRLLHREEAKPAIASLLQRSRLVLHNGAFDMAVIASQWPDLMPAVFDAYGEGRIFDTLIAERMLDIAEGRSLKGQRYGLADLAQKYLNKTLDKTSWRMGYGELDAQPMAQWPDGAKQYAIDDAVTTLEVFEAQLKRLKPHSPLGLPPDVLNDMPSQAHTAFCLHLASCWGVHTDPTAVEALRRRTRQQLVGLRLVLLETGLLRWEAKAEGYVRNVGYARERMRATGSKIHTKKGNLSIGRVACNLCGDAGLEAFGLYSQLSGLLTRLDTLAEGYELPLQSRFVGPLETGRTACRKPAKSSPLKGDQLQNPPANVAGFRENYVPRDEEHCFIDADYGGLELATFAQAALIKVGFSKRAELINAGMDLHIYLAATELGSNYDDVLLRFQQGDPIVKVARNRAKPANFGFLGGMGVAKYVLLCRDKYNMRITEDEAKRQKLAVIRTFPETAPYFAICDREAKTQAYIRSLRSGRYRGGCGYTDTCNNYFQSLGADLANDAVRRVSKECYLPGSALYGCRLWNFVHDQLLLEALIAIYREAAARVAHLMNAAAKHWLPDVRCVAEPIAASCWSKRAVRVTDEDGGLGIWRN